MITRQSQLQRLLKCRRLIRRRDGIEVPSGKLVACIEASIKYSNHLPDFEVAKDDLLQKITATESVGQNEDLLDKALEKIYQVRRLKEDLAAMRETSFSNSNSSHQGHLHTFWTGLLTKPAPEIPDKKWTIIGFQGTDPSTDFRGMGLLGLYQLSQFIHLHRPIAREIFATASKEDSNLWFPFAITGINITAFQFLLLKSGKLDFRLYESIGSAELAYAKIYSDIFNQFHEAWIQANPRDIMEFPRVFAQVKSSFH